MKKILYSIFAIALVVPVLMVPAMASAATFGFASASATVKPGQTFRTTVFVIPNTNEKITTAKLSLKYPSDSLEVVSFTPTAGWIALPLPGSNLIDNTNGKLIKTAGFPAKITTKKQFGTIVFKAKKAGNVKLSTNSDSMLIDPSNVNKYAVSTGINFIIAKPVHTIVPKVKPVITPKPKPVVKHTVKKQVSAHPIAVEAVVATSTVATTTEATTTAPTAPSGITAFPLQASASTGATGDNTKTALIVLAVLTLIIVVWMNRKRIFKK